MQESLDLDSLMGEFRDEARDQVDRVEAGFLRFERDGELGEEARSGLLRTLHTLKGNAGMLGLSAIRDFVHAVENVLKDEPAGWSEPVIERLFEGVAALRRAVEAAGGDQQDAAFRELGVARHRVEELESASARPPEERAPDDGPDEVMTAGADRLRVPFAKLDALLNEVGELLGEADALRAALRNARAGSGLLERGEAIRRRARGLRESVMALRLVPLWRVLGRFHSLVRRLARDQGKEARLVVHGEDTEVDKGTADALAEPLLHLLRNAIDHGIQPPDVREAAGKPRHGTIVVSALQEGDRVRIVVEDDGAGLDLERIRARGREAGLIPPGAEVPESTLEELIFHSGFSTSTDVSTVSGQGVGLDVVRRSVRELRGDLAVQRREEEGGTRFVLRLPLTVAVVPSVVFEAAGEMLALPASSVDHTVRVDRIDRVGPVEVVRVGDDLLPLADPDRLFGWSAASRGEFGVVLRHRGHGAVLTVTRLVDQRDLVVKALPAFGRRPRGVSGASVLPGGRVILLLDPAEVIELSEDRRRGGES